jgi:xylose dehydrogenase (NAD/NADP)
VTRWGILSTARINLQVLEAAQQSVDVEFAAIASRDGTRAEAYARQHGLERAYGSYEELLADPDLDAVYISLPNSLHVEWAMRALEAGKNVLCEKPLSRRTADVAALFDTAERHGLLCMEAFMWRHNPQTKRLSALVADGAIGELRFVRAAFSFPLTASGNVRMVADLDGGALMDVGCYCVSGLRLLAGEPRYVTAREVHAPTAVDIRFAATLEFERDVLAQFDAAFDLPDRSELEAIGSEGSISARDPWHCRTPGLTLRRGERSEQIEIERANSYRLELENLSAAIRGQADPLLGRADALGQARTIESLYRAAASGATVELS